jgi:hypothetical protein
MHLYPAENAPFGYILNNKGAMRAKNPPLPITNLFKKRYAEKRKMNQPGKKMQKH